MASPSAQLLKRVLLAATGVTSVVAGCGGQIEDTATSTSSAGGSGTSAGAGGSTSTAGGASGSSSVGGAGGASGSSGKQAGGAAGTSPLGGTGGFAGTSSAGGAGGAGGFAGIGAGGAGGFAGTSSTGGAGGFGGTSGKAGGAGSVSTGGSAGAGGSVACLPGSCAPGQTMCGSGVPSLFTCQLGPDGCGQWYEQPCSPGTVCSPEQGACVPQQPTSCMPGVACVGGEWCSPSPNVGANDSCSCPYSDSPEKLVCGQPYPWGMTVKVCYDAGDAPCMGVSDPNLYTTVDQRFHLQCSGVQMGPTSELTSKGEARCCYQVGVFGCVGRPMFVETGLRVARLERRAGWA